MDIYNGYFDCHSEDDEALCNVKDSVKNCKCVDFAIKCIAANMTMSKLATIGQFVFVYISENNNILSLYGYLTPVIFLHLPLNKLTDQMIHHTNLNLLSQILFLNISHNAIKGDYNFWSPHLLNLLDFFMQGNRLMVLKSYHFKSLINLRLLDISTNKIKTLQYCCFCGLVNLKVLSLLDNDIYHVSSTLFDFETNDFYICCMIKDLKASCTSKPPWPASCNHLIENRFLRGTNWIVNIMVVSLNAVRSVNNIQVLT